jgi:hypothetical protein
MENSNLDITKRASNIVFSHLLLLVLMNVEMIAGKAMKTRFP